MVFTLLLCDFSFPVFLTYAKIDSSVLPTELVTVVAAIMCDFSFSCDPRVVVPETKAKALKGKPSGAYTASASGAVRASPR